jgi:hypothetical protein
MLLGTSYATVPARGVPGAVEVATVKVAVLMVDGFIASLKVTFTDLLVQMPVAALAGLVDAIDGGVVSTAFPVVNDHWKLLTSALPERSLAAVVIVPLYTVAAVRFAGVVGVKIALLAPTAYETVPVTGVPPGPVNVKLDAVIVDGSMSSLKVTAICEFNAVFVAPAAGTLSVTVGGVTSGAAPVVKVHAKSLGSALPDESVTAVVIVAVRAVAPGRDGAVGVKTAALELAV